MNHRQVFNLFSSCKVTTGYTRSLLMDIQRGVYYLIPLSMDTLLKEKQGFTIEEVINEFYTPEEKEIIEEYFSFLQMNELIFVCNEEVAGLFPSISDSFDMPAQVTNAIININEVRNEYLSNILGKLTNLNCNTIELNICKPVSSSDLFLLLDILKEYEIEDVSLLVCNPALEDFSKLKVKYTYLSSLTIYNALVNHEEYDQRLDYKLQHTTKDLSDQRHCGVVADNYFTPNLNHYTESLAHNTCLNRKISIDVDGNIRNCPSMKESFGNIKDTTLKEAVNKPGFKKYWNITKDEITKCKDCEFRHVCTDCRAYLENPEDIYSAPLKCGYDPYTCEWEDWSTNPLKQKAIEHYGMREIIA